MKMIHDRDPAPSRLLLLPPEIRNVILEELIPRDRCARGYTRFDLAPIRSKACSRQGSLPVSYLRTCRKLYEEGSHFFYSYSTSVFHFERDSTLVHFVDRCSFAQLCSIQHLQFTVPDMIFSFDSWDEIDRGLHLMALEVSEVLHTTRKLQNIQSLDLLVSIPDCPDYWRENGYFTKIIHPLLEHVNNLAIVKVDAKAPSIESLNPYVLKRKDCRPHWSEEFTSFCWALLNLESQKSSIASPTYKAAQEVMDFVLKKCHIL